jgi:hypothetical protein
MKLTREQQNVYQSELKTLLASYAEYRRTHRKNAPLPAQLTKDVAAFHDAWRAIGVDKIARDLSLTKGYLYKVAVRGRALVDFQKKPSSKIDDMVDPEIQAKALAAIRAPNPPPRAHKIDMLSVVIDLNDVSALTRFDELYTLLRKDYSVRLALDVAARAARAETLLVPDVSYPTSPE